MEFVCPGFLDEVDDSAVHGIGGSGEDTGGFVKEDDFTGVRLEDFSCGDEVVKLSQGNGSLGDDVAVEYDSAVFQELFRVAFSEAGAFGDELVDGHFVGIEPRRREGAKLGVRSLWNGVWNFFRVG